MIEGLKLTFSGEELRTLLDARIDDHEKRADGLTREKSRMSDDATGDAALLPEHICENEAARHAWRAAVLQFIRDHLEPAETYRLCAADLEVAELLPARPVWLEQEEHEERSRIGFALERMTKAVDRLAATTSWTPGWHVSAEPAGPPATGVVEETDEFRATRLDLPGGPEVVMIERK